MTTSGGPTGAKPGGCNSSPVVATAARWLQQQYGTSVEDRGQVIRLAEDTDDLPDLYALRGIAHFRPDDHQAALADLEQSIKEPLKNKFGESGSIR